jgi:hypothetical protein
MLYYYNIIKYKAIKVKYNKTCNYKGSRTIIIGLKALKN